MGFLLLAVSPSALLAQDNDGLSKNEIIQRSKQAYAALSSYSDEGVVVDTINGLTITTTFTTRLGRPNLYRIQWQESTSSTALPPSNPAAVWSSGAGDFLDAGIGNGAQKRTQEMALAGATGISSGAAGTIPASFFKTSWAYPFCCAAVAILKRQPDERVGEVDCYVFAGERDGVARTLWIAKQDFLIRQIRRTTSAARMNATMEEDAKENPPDPDVPKIELTESTSLETHTNIVLNQKFSPADFAPSNLGKRQSQPSSPAPTPEN